MFRRAQFQSRIFAATAVALLLAMHGLSVAQTSVPSSASFTAPQLITPMDEARIDCDALRTIMFRWSPSTPLSNQQEPEYKFSCVEVMPGQTAIQALLANQPIVDQNTTGQTYFDWPATIPPPEPGKVYAWTVQAVSFFGPLGQPNGYAYPYTFSCTSTTYCPCAPCDLTISSQVGSGSGNGKEGMIGDVVTFTATANSHCPDHCTPKIITGNWTITFTPLSGPAVTTQGSGNVATFTAPAGGTVHVDFTGWEAYCGASNICDCQTASSDVTIYAGTVDKGNVSVGTTDNPPPVVDSPKVNVNLHHDTTTSCSCECGASAITVQENNYPPGNPKTGAMGLYYTKGVQLTFTLATAGTCSEKCPPQITAQWSMDFTSLDGTTLHNEGAGMTYNFFPPGPGTVTFRFFQVQLSCRAVVCPCEGAEVIVYLGVGVKPPDDLTKACGLQPVSTEKGDPIQVGARLAEAGLFEYPRAVPIRAYGIDWDNMIFTCSECDAKAASTLKWPVPDRVDQFVWKLDGPGSLNSPFKAKNASAAQAEIDQLTALIGSLQAQRDSLSAARADIPDKLKKEQDAAQARLDKINEQKKAAQATIDSLNDATKQLTKIRAGIEQDIASDSGAVISVQQDIRTDSLLREDVIDRMHGRPDAGERKALEDANNRRNDVANAESDVENKQQAVQDGAAGLDQGLDDAQKAEEDADLAYLNQKKSFDAKAGIVNGYLKGLRSDTLYATYADRAKDWTEKFAAWIAMLPASASTNAAAGSAEVNALADSTIAAPVAKQQQMFVLLSGKINALVASLSSQCVTQPCRDAAQVVRDATDAYILAVAAIVQRAKPVDKKALSQLKTARAALDASQSTLNQIAGVAQTAAQAYQGALQNYASKISDLDQQERTAQTALDAKNDQLAQSSETYDSLHSARLDGDASIHDVRADSVQWLDDSLLSKAMQIEQRTRTFTDHVNGRDTNDAAQHEVQRQIDDQQKVIAGLDDIIAKLNAVLQKTDKDELAKIDALIQAVDAQITAARTQLAAAQAKLAEAMKPTKEAAGEVVYYIPPPLEEIMKNKPKFAALKDSVTNAQADYAIAIAAKGQLQGKLLTLMEKISTQLSVLKTAMEDKKRLADTVKSRKKDVEDAGPDNEQENLDAKKKAEAEQKEAADKAKEWKDKADETTKKISEQKKKLSKPTEDLKVVNQNVVKNIDDLYKAEVDRKKQALAYKDAGEKWVGAATGRAVLRDQLRAANQDYVRVFQKLERAQLANHPDEVAALQTTLNAKKDEIKKLNDAAVIMDKEENTLDVTAQNIEKVRDAAKNDETKARDQLGGNTIGRNVLRKKIRNLTDSLDDLTAAAREQQEQRDAQQKIADDAADKLSKLKDALKANEKLKAAKEKLDEAQKQLDEADKNITSSKNAIGKAKLDKQKLVDDATRNVKDAKDRVDNNKKALHDFLADEFNHVSMTAKISIIGDDMVLDGYRSDDPAVGIVQNISYMGSRTPVFPEVPVVDKHNPSVATVQECPPVVSFDKNGGPSGVDPSVLMNEPRTIALLYRNGEPLWPEWPVIPESAPPLAKETPLLLTDGTDNDMMIYACGATGDCLPTDSTTSPIADLTSEEWNGAHIINGTVFPVAIVEYQDPDKSKCEGPEKFGCKIHGDAIVGDKPFPEGMQVDVTAGAMIEVPDSLIGSPGESLPFKPRVVKGNHKGLPGESIKLTAKLTKGNAKNFGFIDGDHTQDKSEKLKGQTPFTKSTDGQGYADVSFYFGEGVGEFDIDVQWMRSGECAKKTIHAKTPLQLSFLRLAGAAPSACWKAATKVWNGADIDATANAMPAAHDDKGKITDDYATTVDAVGGLLDHNRDSVNGVDIGFDVDEPDSSEASPDHAKTELWGWARVEVEKTPDEGELTMEDSCTDDDVRELCDPQSATKTRSAAGIDKFKIGTSNPFVVQLESKITCGEAQSGTGKLTLDGGTGAAGEFLNLLGINDGVDVSFDGIVVDCDGGDTPTATDGTVTWAADKSVEIRSYTVTVSSLSISAGKLATVVGTVRKDSVVKDAIGFSGGFDADGNFIAGIDNLPEISIAGFKLQQGAAVMLDFGVDPTELKVNVDPAFDNFGLIIPSATLQLPSPFTRGKDTTTISVKDFTVDKSGVSGNVTLQGGIEFGFGGFSCKVKKGQVNLQHNAINDNASISATITLPKPVDGKVDALLSYNKVGDNGSSWKCVLTSKDTIKFPSVGIAAVLSNASIERKSDGTDATYEAKLSCTLSSNGKFDTIKINELKISSAGSVTLKDATINKNTSVGTGFSFHVDKFSFTIDPPNEKYEANLVGGFALPAIGLESASGHVNIKKGGVIDMGLDSATIAIDKSPFTLNGELKFGNDVWEGSFDVKLKGLPADPNDGPGLTGMIIYGTQKVSDIKSYTYWYGELKLTLADGLPLGQSGVKLTEIGGGVGMNYNPPINAQPGSPVDAGDGLAFKAMVGLADASGNLIAGRVTMILFLQQQYFSLGGKVWLFKQEKSMFGEGVLTLRWGDPVGVDGSVRMFIGIPDAKGKVARFNGDVRFAFYKDSIPKVDSKDISASILEALRFKGKLNFSPDKVHIDGKLWYDLGETNDAGGNGNKPKTVGPFIIEAHLLATAAADYNNPFAQGAVQPTLSLQGNFHGQWNVGVQNPFDKESSVTLLNGLIDLSGKAQATVIVAGGSVSSLNASFEAHAAIHASVDLYFGKLNYDVNDVDLGYSVQIP